MLRLVSYRNFHVLKTTIPSYNTLYGIFYSCRVFHSEVGVTAMDFSLTNPNLLAVGLYDGTIAVYNVKVSDSDPVLDTFECNQRHTAPVWQLKWIQKEKGKGMDSPVFTCRQWKDIVILYD